MQKKRVRMGIIGIGAMGRKYVELLSDGSIPELELTAVSTRNPDTREWVRSIAGDIIICSDSEAFFANADAYDAVLIVTPHSEHPRLAIQAFERKKHVFCDKPAGICFSDAIKMNEAAQKEGKAYAMMFHNRVYPSYRKGKEIVDKRLCGEIKRMGFHSTRYFRTQYYHHSSSWRSSWNGEGGGLLINQAHHPLDLWQWFFGMPEYLYAEMKFGKYNPFEVEDEVYLLMDYENQRRGSFFASSGEAPAEEYFEIFGTEGKAVITESEVILWHYPNLAEYQKTASVTSAQNLTIEKEEFHYEIPDNCYTIMLQNFGRHILYQEPLIAPGMDGIYALLLCNSAYLSAWERKKVKLPISEQRFSKMLKERQEREKQLIQKLSLK